MPPPTPPLLSHIFKIIHHLYKLCTLSVLWINYIAERVVLDSWTLTESLKWISLSLQQFIIFLTITKRCTKCLCALTLWPTSTEGWKNCFWKCQHKIYRKYFKTKGYVLNFYCIEELKHTRLFCISNLSTLNLPINISVYFSNYSSVRLCK